MSGTTPKKKSLWVRQLKLLESISFESIAAEINARRLQELNEKLAGPLTAREQKLYQRSRARAPLAELPGDLRAVARRMRDTLLAMHRLISTNRTWVFRLSVLAEKMGCSEATGRRGTLDLATACVIAVTRRERERRQGGQGPSEYLIVWPTIRDLAATQGVQLSLFDDTSVIGTPAAAGRPDIPSGRESVSGAPFQNERAPFQNERAPFQNERAPFQNERAPFQGEKSLSRPAGVRARGRSFLLPFLTSSSSSLSKGEEEEIWNCQVAPRLTAYGLGDLRTTVGAAIRSGWTARQVLDLLAACERETVPAADGTPIRAWGPGAVCRHLSNGFPGSAIPVQPAEAFRRAKRDREQRQRVSKSGTRLIELEALFGADLDGLSANEQADLVRELGPVAVQRMRQVGPGGMRGLLLASLAKRAPGVTFDST